MTTDLDTLTAEVHALALAMVSLDSQIAHAQLLGRRTLQEELQQRRKLNQKQRSVLLVELIIERQLTYGRIG
jgi:hypothetical protein